MKNIYNFNHKELHSFFINACYLGDLDIVIKLTTIYPPKLFIDENNEINLVDTNFVIPFIDITSSPGAFNISCGRGHLHLVKFFLTNFFYKNFTSNPYQINSGFLDACTQGQLNIVKYFLENPNISQHLVFNEDDPVAFSASARCGHLDTLRYLLNSPKVNRPENMKNVHDAIFWDAFKKDQYSILYYLICEYKIEKTSKIQSILKSFPKENINAMFSSREIYKKLSENLVRKDFPESLSKI